jgi:DNA-binding response OmpR family regulator
MRATQSDPLPDSQRGRSTHFPIVPLGEIPASGSVVDKSEFRPVVLVVDKEPAVADSLVATLHRSGYAAVAAYDGEGALESAFLVPPEVVIADVELPGINGFELAIALKSTIPDCRILLLSGQETTPELPASASGGAHEFEVLNKAIKPSDLFAHVSACLEPRKG